MSKETAFQPEGDTVNIDVSAASQVVRVGTGYQNVRICNLGSATVWINYGGSTVTATTTTGIPIPGNGFVEVQTPKVVGDNNLLYVAAIAAAATGKIYFTPGIGV